MLANLWMGFDDRGRVRERDADGNDIKLDVDRHRGGGHEKLNLWRKDVPAGPRDYELWSLYYDVADSNELRGIRNDLNAEFPGQLRTIGAWWWDGRQVGTEFIYEDITRDVLIDDPDVIPPMIDDPDYIGDPPIPQIVDPAFDWPQITVQVTSTEITGTSGTPDFPLHTSILEYIPDEVTYDANGNETGRARPTAPKNVNILMGQALRRFT